MKISFLFPTEILDLHIELINNPAVTSWAEHFKNGFLAKANIQNYYVIFPHDPIKLEEYLGICRLRIEQLKEIGYVYNGPLPNNINDIDRNFTNQLHRFFTHNQHVVNHAYWPELSLNEHITKQKSITSLLQDVNENVHLIERYLKPVPDINSESLQEIYLSAEPAYDHPTWWAMDHDYRQYHTDNHADIIFGSQILGKTLLRSFLDGDDPVDWDTTGHYANNGTLQILPTNGREQIYNSKQFNQWLLQHNINRSNVFFDFPVGNIINRSILAELQSKMLLNKNLIPVRYTF